MDNLDNGLELLSGRLVVLFLTYDLALKASANFPAGTKVKVTNDPNPDLNGEYTWDGKKLVKTTNNTLEKAKEEAEKAIYDKLETVLTPDKILDIISGQISESDLDQNLRQRIDEIESISPIVDKLKKDVKKAQEEVDEKIFFLDVDYNNLKEEVKNIQDQVDLDFKEIQDRIDQIQAEVDAKWIEVDEIRDGLQKEIQDRIAAVREETEARIEDIRKLNDGLTQEIIDRKDGDTKLYENIENYKVSNNEALANVRQEVKVAVDTANASAEKVDAMDARVKIAEDNSGKALENSAAAVQKSEAAADLASATASRVDSMQADVIKAVDDSGKALTNSATALEQSKAAADLANATAESVTVLDAKLNTKNSTYRQDTAPTKASHPNLTEGDIWINPSNNNEQKRWNGTDWVDISDVRVGQNAQAISELKVTVKEQGDKLTSVAEQVTSLEATIGDMATSEALEQLKTTVTKQGDNIAANTEKLTALETTVGKNQEANSKALQDLNTRVDKTDEKVAANASAITALNSTVNASMNAINITADMSLTDDLIFYEGAANVTKEISESGTTRRVLSVGDNDGNDMAWMYPKAMLPFDPDVMYKVRAKLRRVSGDGIMYIGLIAKTEDKSRFVNSANQIIDGPESAAYLAEGLTPVGEWVEFEWYIKGRAVQGALLPPANGGLGNPVQMQNATAYITPVVIVNYSRMAGKYEIAYVVLERAEAYKVISANANALTSLKTDVQKNTDGIKAMGEAITNVEASVTNMDIGGQNLWTLWNKKFEQPSPQTPYINIDWLNENEEWYRATLIKDVDEYQNYFTGIIADPNYPMVIGEDYTVSFEVRASRALVFNTMYAYFGDLYTISKTNIGVDTEWKTYQFTAKANGTNISGVYQLFGFLPRKAEGWVNGDWFEVRRLQLQKGNKATRYQKAQAGLIEGIKANAQAFTSLKATVDTQGDTITAQGQAITGLQAEIKDKASSQALSELKTTVTEQGDAIKSQGQAITSAQAKVDNIKIGTGNILRNSSFAEDSVSWTVNPSVTDISFVPEANMPSGQRSYMRFTSNNAGAGFYQGAPDVRAGEEVMFSIWARGETGNEKLRLLWESHETYQDVNLTTSWARYTIKTKPVYNSPNVVIYTINSGVFHYSCAQYERGNIPSDWHPNMADMASAKAFTSLKSTVDVIGDKVTANSEAITSVQATADLALNGKSTVVDLTALDPNLYYPVFIPVSAGVGIAEIEIDMPLYTAPAPWASHGSGTFSMNLRWRIKGSGWGANPTEREILRFGYAWTQDNQSPAMYIDQIGESSREFIYLRGATKYRFTCNQHADFPRLELSSYGGIPFDPAKVPASLGAMTNANAAAVTTLDAKVDIVGNKVDVNSQAITGLQSEIKDKASTEALNQLKTTVTQQGDAITAQGQAITKVESKVDNISVGGKNLIKDSGTWMGPLAAATGIQSTYSAERDVMFVWASAGNEGWLANFFSPEQLSDVDINLNENDDVIFSVDVLIENGSTVKGPSVYWKGPMNYMPLTLVKGQELRYNEWYRFYQTRKYAKGGIAFHFNFADMTGTYRFRRPVIEKGNIPTDWSVSDNDFATARAVQSLDTKITNTDGRVSVNAQAITDLRTDLDKKASAQALSDLSTTVREQGDTISSQGRAITSVEATANRTSSQLGTTISYMMYTFRNGASLSTKTGIYKADGTRLEGVARGLNVYLFAANGDFVSLRFFDTYGNTDVACNNMVAYLADLPQDSFIAILGCDNIGPLQYPSDPPRGLKNHLRDVWGVAQSSLDRWQGNDIPMVICRKWGPKNSAIDKLYTSSINGDWFSLGITFINGIPNDWGGDTSKANIEANASAITTLNADVVKNTGDIKVNADAITGLSCRIDGKADAQALNQLQITVREQGDTISSQGRAITQVQATADMALNGKKYVVDLSGLDPNLYYPVFIPLSSTGVAEININASLDEYQAPWATHGSKTYSLNVRWRVRGSGWGANTVEREMLRFGYAWCGDQSPLIEINQRGDQSREYIYLRGGTQYPFYVNQYAGQPFTDLGNFGGVPYRTDLMPKTINAMTSANASAVSTLDAKVDIVDGKATSAAESVTKLQTSSTAATYQLLRDSNKIREKPVGSNPYPFYSAVYDKVLTVGKTYTLVYEAEFQSGGANSFFRPYFSETQHFSETNQSFGRQVFVVKAQLWAQNTDAINFYIVGSQPDQNNSYAKVYWACLYEEDQPNPIKVWMPNTRENSAKLEVQGQSIDGLMTKWSVKADVNGLVSGVAMNNDGNSSDFIIRANTFAIAPPTTANAGDVGKYAFVYQSTPRTLPNGTVIPAGLYVDSLMLGEINANRINANELSAISANLGTLTTYKDPAQPTKARMVMQGSLITVYDDNNVVRVKMGLW